MGQPTFTRTYLDASEEKSTVQINTKPISGATISEFNELVNTTELGAFAMALDAITLCTPIGGQVAMGAVQLPYAVPADVNAQREVVLVVSYQDNVTNKKYRVSIPGVNWGQLNTPKSDKVNESAALWIAFKAAFETIGRSPDGNAITVLGGRRAGRNV